MNKRPVPFELGPVHFIGIGGIGMSGMPGMGTAGMGGLSTDELDKRIADLKAALAKAADQVKGFLKKIGLLTSERDRAEAEVEELRAVLYPTEEQAQDPLRPHLR